MRRFEPHPVAEDKSVLGRRLIEERFKNSLNVAVKSGRDPSLRAAVCEQPCVSGEELLFDARRVTTIAFTEVEQPATVGGV
jgi:hypothetical protein